MDHAVKVEFRCNGADREVQVPPDQLLIDALRDDLGLTGTKLGCGTGDCGACTVMVDGAPVCSCLVFTAQCQGATVETVEGIAQTPEGQEIASAFVAHGAVQCGACIPGMVVSATGLLRTIDGPASREQIEDALAGNLCRCTGYVQIIDAVRAASERTACQGSSAESGCCQGPASQQPGSQQPGSVPTAVKDR